MTIHSTIVESQMSLVTSDFYLGTSKDPFGWGIVNHLILKTGHITAQGAAMGDAESQVIVGRMALEGLKVVVRYVSLDILCISNEPLLQV